MSVLDGQSTTVRYALGVGAVLLLLAGLFGMHGLGVHGTAGMGPMARAAMNESSSFGPRGAGPALSMLARDTAPAIVASAVATGRAAMDRGMEGMCLAILTVALVSLFRLLCVDRTSLARWVLPRQVRAPARQGREPDPPSLISLSIQRC